MKIITQAGIIRVSENDGADGRTRPINVELIRSSVWKSKIKSLKLTFSRYQIRWSYGESTRSYGKRALVFAITFLLVPAYPAIGAVEQKAAPISAKIASSRQIDFRSVINGEKYRLEVALPFVQPPPRGYAVLYVLDGDHFFGSFAEAVRRVNPPGDGFIPTIVVGIGYPDASLAEFRRRRAYDFTSAHDTGIPAEACGLATSSKQRCFVGGSEAFLQVILKEIKPKISTIVPIDAERTTVLGHSLAGLFALRVMFSHPDTFGTYVALSPSLWVGNLDVLKDETAFEKRPTSDDPKPRIFIGVGGLESGMGMIDNATELAERLQDQTGTSGLNVQFKLYPNVTHPAMPWAALNDVLSFALGENQVR